MTFVVLPALPWQRYFVLIFKLHEPSNYDVLSLCVNSLDFLGPEAKLLDYHNLKLLNYHNLL